MSIRSALCLLVCLVAALTFSATATADEYDETVLAGISVNAGTPQTSQATKLSGRGVITNVRVDVMGITHTYPADLDVMIESPTHKFVYLFSDGCGGTPITGFDFFFDDSHANAIDTTPLSCDPLNQRPSDVNDGADTWSDAPGAAPTLSLSTFNGDNPTGLWRIHVSDDVPAFDHGSIGSWRLRITTDDYGETRVPASGEGDPAAPTVELTKSISMPNREIQDVNLIFNGLSHSFFGDLAIGLQSPDGTTSAILSQTCGTATIGGGTLEFDDSAADPLPNFNTSPCGESGGTYKPMSYANAADNLFPSGPAPPYQTGLAAFNGKLPSGVWRLLVSDRFNPDHGYIGDFDLAITLAGAKTVTTSKPKLKYKKSGKKSIAATGRVRLTSPPIQLLECTGSVKSQLQAKRTVRVGGKKRSLYKKVASTTSNLDFAGGKCGYGLKLKLPKRFAGAKLRLVSNYLGGESIAPFSRTTRTIVPKLKFK